MERDIESQIFRGGLHISSTSVTTKQGKLGHEQKMVMKWAEFWKIYDYIYLYQLSFVSISIIILFYCVYVLYVSMSSCGFVYVYMPVHTHMYQYT